MLGLNRRSILVSAAPLAIVVACSSSSNNGKAPPPGTTGDAGAVTLADGATVQVSPACDQQIAFQQRCSAANGDRYGGSQACADGRRANCDATLATWSAAYTSAVQACVNAQTDCNNGPGDCIDQQMTAANLQPDDVQKKVRDDFCKLCSALGDCTNAFYKYDPNNGDGPGVIIFTLSDALAQQVDQQCMTPSMLFDASAGDDGGTLDCINAFSQCVADVESSAQPNDPDACYPPYTGDDGGSGGDDGSSDAPADAPRTDAGKG
jgi:hypothetical protein